MTTWMTAYAAALIGIVAITVVLAVAGMKRLEKERERIRDNVHKGGFISAEEFQRDWISMRANGRKGTAGYKYEDGPGCYVIESFPVGTENPDFEHPNEVYVGQSLHICNRVRNHLNGKGNGDVYADVREGKPVFVHLERCEEAQMDSLNEISLGSKFKFVGTNGYLPTPSSAYIAGADGKWYDTDGNGYIPADIPSNKAMTYTAVPPLRSKTAFAVYSADDNSLNFYKRASVPSVGEQFEGKTATAVYTGIEDTNFTIECVSGNRPGGWVDSTSWASYKPSIKTITVVDDGITPKSVDCWFRAAPFTTSALENCNLAKLNTASLTSMHSLFWYCESLTSLDVSGWNTSNVTDMTDMFMGCSKLSVDCSSWDVSKVTNRSNFNVQAPGVIVPLAWQTSSDVSVEDSAIAPLCEEQGSRDSLSVADESGNVETGIGANTSTDVADAIKKAVKGNSSIEADAANENDLTLAPCRDKAENTVSEKGYGRVEEKKQ